jgi:ribosomal protein S18 acetylase RimI-like enzyme
MSIESIHIRRFEPALVDDFFRLHSPANDHGWCFCAAWWTPAPGGAPTWDGWGERSAEQNRAVRQELLERGEYDGYLLYESEEPAGWCQAGKRDRLEKLCRQMGLEPDPHAWAITCFFIAPAHRKRGLARRLLHAVLEDLRARGARRVEAFPKRGEGLDEMDLWNGPEAMFLQAGFRVVKDHPARPVLVLELFDGG